VRGAHSIGDVDRATALDYTAGQFGNWLSGIVKGILYYALHNVARLIFAAPAIKVDQDIPRNREAPICIFFRRRAVARVVESATGVEINLLTPSLIESNHPPSANACSGRALFVVSVRASHTEIRNSSLD
jgi:hypothetical protein